MAPSLHIAVLICLAASAARADSRNQTFDDFATPLPVKPGETLVLGIVGGWERWDNPGRCIRRTAISIKRRELKGVWVETVENHKIELAERLVREAVDFNRDGTLGEEEAKQARVVLFGQSLGGRAALRLARTLNGWGVTFRLVAVVDGYGKDEYTVPPNVLAAANWFQRDHLFIKGAPLLRAEDPARTRILFNRKVSYKGRGGEFEIDEQSRSQTFFMGAHLTMEFDMPLWREVEEMVTSAALGRD
jgi:pimeloyl-ACP methyl ester carboxylesterase